MTFLIICRRRPVIIFSEEILKERAQKKLKEDLYRAQRMYYLCLKFEHRVPEYFLEFSKNILNIYTRRAKEAELTLTPEELCHRLLQE